MVSAAQAAPSNSGTVKVELNPIVGCSACSSVGGCGVQLLPATQQPVVLDCQINANATVSIGDQVNVDLPDPDNGWLVIVGYAYGLPTLGMVFGALIGYWAAIALQIPQYTESLSLAGFVVGLAGGLIAWTRAEKAVRERYVGDKRLEMARIIQER